MRKLLHILQHVDGARMTITDRKRLVLLKQLVNVLRYPNQECFSRPGASDAGQLLRTLHSIVSHLPLPMVAPLYVQLSVGQRRFALHTRSLAEPRFNAAMLFLLTSYRAKQLIAKRIAAEAMLSLSVSGTSPSEG